MLKKNKTKGRREGSQEKEQKEKMKMLGGHRKTG